MPRKKAFFSIFPSKSALPKKNKTLIEKQSNKWLWCKKCIIIFTENEIKNKINVNSIEICPESTQISTKIGTS